MNIFVFITFFSYLGLFPPNVFLQASIISVSENVNIFRAPDAFCQVASQSISSSFHCHWQCLSGGSDIFTRTFVILYICFKCLVS